MALGVQIPFLNLSTQYQEELPELIQALTDVANSGRCVNGPQNQEFEAAFARYCEAPYAVGVANGTSALRLALQACGVGPGDEVIVPVLTFVATASAVAHLGARPVLVEVDPATFLMDPEAVRAAIGPRTRTILPVHLYGLPAEMDTLSALAGEHGLALLEDASQAHGATYRGRKVGSLSRAACFSLYPTKNLGALGEAGVVTTADPAVAKAVRLWREHCKDEREDHLDFGYNERLDTLQAAFLLVRMRRLERHIAERQAIAARYRRLLANTPLRWQAVPDDRTHAYHLCVALAPDRDDLRRYLSERGVETMIHYRRPLHLLPPLQRLGYRSGQFRVAEALNSALVSLPCYPGLSTEAVETVAGQLAEFYGCRLASERGEVAYRG
ncbi:MAG: DegT/DnrJ/EryC1/StrS family aminotransferase [Bacillota bacterium]